MAKLTVVTGPMFSFKTQTLKRFIERKQFSRLETLVIKTDIGLRQGPRDIQAEIVRNKEEVDIILKKYNPDFLGVEECQFFGPWIVDVIDRLMEKNVTRDFEIVVVGLDMDSNKKPFGVMPILMAKANEVIKVTGICTMCKKDGNLSYLKRKDTAQKDAAGNTIKAGDLDEYEVRCAICHNLAW
ncbi:MAG: hypothetical protein WCO84_03460 [bacterium]